MHTDMLAHTISFSLTDTRAHTYAHTRQNTHTHTHTHAQTGDCGSPGQLRTVPSRSGQFGVGVVRDTLLLLLLLMLLLLRPQDFLRSWRGLGDPLPPPPPPPVHVPALVPGYRHEPRKVEIRGVGGGLRTDYLLRCDPLTVFAFHSAQHIFHKLGATATTHLYYS